MAKIALNKLELKNYLSIIIILVSIIFSSCVQKKNNNENINTDTIAVTAPVINSGVVFERLTKNNSTYSCYIPSGHEENKKFPVIILLDPHADGKLPLEKYKNLAEKFKFILVGSHSTKNGMEIDQSIQVVIDLINEAQYVLPGLPGQITVAGFSGGAKVALLTSNSVGGLNSVIYCGASLPAASLKINTPAMGIAGQYDMNYTEVRNFNYSLSVVGIDHALVEWKGKHEWPDSSAFIHAFYWNIFTSMKNKSSSKNDSIILEFKSMMHKKIEQEKNVLVKSELLQEEIEMLTNLSSTDESKNKLSALNKSAEFKNAFSKFSETMKKEDEMKKLYIKSFEEKDIVWWSDQVRRLNVDVRNESNRRILGYISLASWTYSTKALAANNNSFAFKALQIYKLSDPENSEQPYLMACLYAKNNMNDSAIFYLNESFKLGLNDKNKVESEKDLSTLHTRNDYQEIVGRMR